MNQFVRIEPLTPDAVCDQVQDSMKSLLARTTLTLDEMVDELTKLYGPHLYVEGTFSSDVVLGAFRGICFRGRLCGENRTIAVY